MFRKLSRVPMCSWLPPPFSTIKFIDSGFMLKCLIHLDMNFVQDTESKYIFILLHRDIQLYQHHLLTIQSFSQCKYLASLSKTLAVRDQPLAAQELKWSQGVSRLFTQLIFLSEEEKQFSGVGKREKLFSLDWLQQETFIYTHLQGLSIFFIFQKPFLYSSQ